MKTCDNCGKEYIRKYRPTTKYPNLCSICNRKMRDKDYRQSHKKEISVHQKVYIKTHREKINAYQREYNKKYLKKKVEIKFGHVKEPCFIYKITNLITKQFYIGKTINYEQRFMAHRRELGQLRHPNSRLQDDWITYGNDNFEYKIILICDRMNLTLYEYRIIKKLKPYYNLLQTLYNDNKKYPLLCSICDKERIVIPHAPLCKKCYNIYAKNKKFKEYPEWLKFLIYNWRHQTKASKPIEISFSNLEKPYRWSSIEWDYGRKKFDMNINTENPEFIELKKGLLYKEQKCL